MEILIERKWKKPNYTIGILSIDGKRFCETLEDVDRGLNSSMTIDQIKAIKIYNETAIPTGTYKITLDTYSQRFGYSPFYKRICKGNLPRLLNVKGFDGILIHCGNTNLDTSGCILVGRNLKIGKVLKSKETFEKLYNILKENKDNLIIKIL